MSTCNLRTFDICSNHGICVKDSCECFNGYMGSECGIVIKDHAIGVSLVIALVGVCVLSISFCFIMIICYKRRLKTKKKNQKEKYYRQLSDEITTSVITSDIKNSTSVLVSEDGIDVEKINTAKNLNEPSKIELIFDDLDETKNVTNEDFMPVFDDTFDNLNEDNLPDDNLLH